MIRVWYCCCAYIECLFCLESISLNLRGKTSFCAFSSVILKNTHSCCVWDKQYRCAFRICNSSEYCGLLWIKIYFLKILWYMDSYNLDVCMLQPRHFFFNLTFEVVRVLWTIMQYLGSEISCLWVIFRDKTSLMMISLRRF